MLHSVSRLAILCALAAVMIGIAPGAAIGAPPHQDAPTLLAYGQTVDGSITPEQPTQLYAFDAQANDVITITMLATSGDLDPFITLTDAQELSLATDDNSGGGVDARLAFVIPATGRYLIQASHAGGLLAGEGGTFSLNLTAATGDGPTRTPLPTTTPIPTIPVEPTTTPEVSATEAPAAPGMASRWQPLASTISDILTRDVAFRLYWFEAQAGDTISVTPEASDDFTPRLVLYDAAFAEVQAAGPGEALTADLAADGTYVVGVALPDAGSAGGPYSLAVQSDSLTEPTTTPTAEPGGADDLPPTLPADYQDLPSIALGETAEGEIDNLEFMDIYVFLGTAGESITAEMNSQNADKLNGLDPYLILLDENRIPLAEHDDIVDGVERDARLDFTLPQTGYYAIVATRFDQAEGTSIGPYTLTLSASDGTAAPGEPAGEGESAPLSAVPLAANTPVQAAYDGTPDAYTFEGQAGELIDLSVTSDAGVDPVLILADKALDEVISTGEGALTGIRLPTAGQYYVLITARFGPADAASGGYILALNQLSQATTTATPSSANTTPTDDEPEPITYGETMTGTIDDAIVSRLYTFTAAAGDRVQITLRAAEGSTLDTYLELRGPDGELIDANDDIEPGEIRDSQIVATLAESGEYQVLVSRYVGPDADPTTGDYVLTIEPAPEETASVAGFSSEVTPITYGQTQAGEITDEQYLRFFTFDGAAGDLVTIEVEHLSGNLDTVMHLYQANGDGWSELAYNDDSPIGGTYEPLLSNLALPVTGKYLIAVSRYGLEKEPGMLGTFAVTLTRSQ